MFYSVWLCVCVGKEEASRPGQYQLHFPSPMTKICGAFINRVLPSSYGGQPKGIAVACIVLVVAEIILTNNLWGIAPHMALGSCSF